MKHKEIFGIFTFLILLVISIHFDSEIIKFIETNRIAGLDTFAVFITDAGLYIISAIIGAYLLQKKQYMTLSLLIVAGAFSLELTFLLKKIFQAPRPFHNPEDLTIPLTYVSGYAFPSMHAAFCLAVIPPIYRYFKQKTAKYPLILLFILIAFSRLYVGVHYASDIILGGIIGYTTGRLLVYLEEKHQIYQRIFYHFRTNLEVRRQTMHLVAGLTITFLLYLDILNIEILTTLFTIGLVLVIFMRRVEIPYISPVLKLFERESELKKFPAKGPIFLLLGAIISLLIFEKNIALASIAIMAVGDAVAPIYGIYFGKYINPFNKAKHLDSIIVATVCSAMVAFTFVDLEKAIIAGFAGMLFEAFTAEYVDRIIDDNVLIPLVAGGVMTMLAG